MTYTSTLAATLLANVAATSIHAAGQITAPAPVAHRDQPLEAHIWYPAQDGGTKIKVGKNAVFKGETVNAGASQRWHLSTGYPVPRIRRQRAKPDMVGSIARGSRHDYYRSKPPWHHIR